MRQQIPALGPLTGLVVGICLYIIGCPWWLVVILSAASVPLIRIGLVRASVALLCASVGWMLAYIERPSQLPPDIDSEEITVSGRVLQKYNTSSGYALLLSAGSINDKEVHNLKIRVLTSCHQVEVNDFLACQAKVAPEFEEGRVPFTQDKSDISATVFATDITALRAPSGFIGFTTSLRRELIKAVSDSPANDSTKAFLIASFIGERAYLEPSERENLTAVGLAHLLAISGFHVGLVSWAVTLLLWPLRAFRGAFRWLPLVGLVVIWLYILMTGCMVPAVRAGIMISCAAVALIMQRPSAPFNALALAALIILFISPYALLEPGFQLSFSATLSLLVWTAIFKDFEIRHRTVAKVLMTLTLPVAVTLGTLIPVLWHFHAVPLWFLPANIVVVAIMPLFILAGVYMMVLSAAGITAPSIAWPVNTMYKLIDSFTEWLTSSGSGSYIGIVLSPEAIAVCCMTAFSVLVLWWTRRRVWAGIALLGALAIWPVNKLTLYTPADTEMYVDVFHGHTVVLVKNNREVGVWSPAGVHDSLSLLRRYSAYATVAGGRPQVIKDRYDDGFHVIRHNALYLDGRKILFLCGTDNSTERGCDAVMYCRGAKSHVKELVEKHGAGIIYLAPDLSDIRAAKVTAECAELEMPCHSLKSSVKGTLH